MMNKGIKKKLPRGVILSERSESKDLRTDGRFAVNLVRRSFDFGLRPALRMTEGDCCADSPDLVVLSVFSAEQP